MPASLKVNVAGEGKVERRGMSDAGGFILGKGFHHDSR